MGTKEAGHGNPKNVSPLEIHRNLKEAVIFGEVGAVVSS